MGQYESTVLIKKFHQTITCVGLKSFIYALDVSHFFVVDIQSVRQHSNGRRIYFSSFHPDAVHLLGSLQSTYPVKIKYLHTKITN
jgi:glycerophosphoryl diester phosphodiesterase